MMCIQFLPSRALEKICNWLVILEKVQIQSLQFNWIMLFILHRHGVCNLFFTPLASSCATPCYSQVLFMCKQQRVIWRIWFETLVKCSQDFKASHTRGRLFTILGWHALTPAITWVNSNFILIFALYLMLLMLDQQWHR